MYKLVYVLLIVCACVYVIDEMKGGSSPDDTSPHLSQTPSSPVSNAQKRLTDISSPQLSTPPALDSKAVQTAISPPPSIELIGTIGTATGYIALVQWNGRVHRYRANDRIEKWRFSVIGARRITLSLADQTQNYFMRESNDITQAANDTQDQHQRTQERIRLAAIARMQNPSFAAKVKRYMHGRQPWEVRYPMGVEAQGVTRLSTDLWELDLNQAIKGVSEASYLTHVALADKKDTLELKEVVPGSLFDQVGLQDGDVITSINDYPVKSRLDLLKVYQSIENDGDLNIAYTRNNHAQAIKLLVVTK